MEGEELAALNLAMRNDVFSLSFFSRLRVLCPSVILPLSSPGYLNTLKTDLRPNENFLHTDQPPAEYSFCSQLFLVGRLHLPLSRCEGLRRLFLPL